MTTDSVHDDVKAYYRKAARDRTSQAAPSDGSVGAEPACCDDTGRWGTSRYDHTTLAEGSDAAANLSMGCGNPYALAALAPGETVLDLGSGGGLDVILSAKRVAPAGKAFGVDFLPEMLEIARRNAAEAGVDNVEFLEGTIEQLPLDDETVDVVISNCVINLAPDKTPVFAEIVRVLKPGGRLAVSDVVADNSVVPPDDGTVWAECGAGALERDTYLTELRTAGLADATIEYTHDVGPGLHGAAIRAIKPGT